MGLACKPTGKFKSIMRKVENKLENDKRAHKNKKRMVSKFGTVKRYSSLSKR